MSSSAVCGVAHEENSLVFEGLGTRKLQTKSMDTTNTRFTKIKHYRAQFYFKQYENDNIYVIKLKYKLKLF